MRIIIAVFAAGTMAGTPLAEAEMAASISRTVELREPVDMDCVASAALGIPGVSSVTRPAPSEPYVASPNEIKTDRFVYAARGFDGTLSFAPGFLGNSIYYRHTVDFPDGTPSTAQVATIRSFMVMVDHALARRCNIEGLGATQEECEAVPCPKPQ